MGLFVDFNERGEAGNTFPQTAYRANVWSHDSGSPGERVSDWYANGVLVVDDYTFDGELPVGDWWEAPMIFLAGTDASGRLVVEGVKASGSDLSVFINALGLEHAPGDPAKVVEQPVSQQVWAGTHVSFSGDAGGLSPVHFSVGSVLRCEVQVERGTVTLTILTPSPSAAYARYAVEQACDPRDPGWTVVRGVIFGEPNGNLVTATFPQPADRCQYYRVQYVP